MKTEYQNSIINKVRQIRNDRKISQIDISVLLNISPGQVGNIETPSRPHKYTLSQLALLCDEFEINIQDLFLENYGNLSKDELIKRLINSIIEYEKQ